MLIQPTLDTLNRLKLHGIAVALSEQMTHGAAQTLAFEERLALLLDREALHRENKRMTRLLQLAQLKERAALEDIDYRSRTGLDRPQLASLAACDWVRSNQNVLIHGATGCSKTYLRLFDLWPHFQSLSESIFVSSVCCHWADRKQGN